MYNQNNNRNNQYNRYEYNSSNYNSQYQPPRRNNNRKKRSAKVVLYFIIMLVLILLLIILCLVACNGKSKKDDDGDNFSSAVVEIEDVPSTPQEDEPESLPVLDPQVSSEPEEIDDVPLSGDELIKAISEYQSGEKSELLQLVNTYNRLPSDYDPELADISSDRKFSVLGAEALKQMISDCNDACDGTLWAQSTFRSYSKQTKLYDNETKRWEKKGMSEDEARAKAATIVAIPGTSEHNTGLCCDFNTVSEDFADTDMYDWLIEHCHEYGFIERYPKDKQDITNIIWEPWHYRYVGVEAATEIMENGWCLEEYHYYKGL